MYETFDVPYGQMSMWGSMGQGYIWTDNYSFFGSEDDHFGYREMSLGGQYEFLNRYSVNMQGEYRDAGKSDDLGLRLSQAFIDAHFEPIDEAVVGANLGRVEVPFGFYNRTRDRIDTRPSIILPQSIYLESLGFRNYILTGDGGMLYGLYDVSKDARLESKAAVVKSSFGDIGGLEDSPLVSGWLEYGWRDDFKIRLTMLGSEDDGTQLTFPVLSAQYLWDRWTFTSEYGQLKFEAPLGRVSADGVYGQIEYAVSPGVSLFGRYDYLKFDVDTAQPIIVPDDLLRAQSFAFGLGYQMTKNCRLNAEYHFVDGKAFLNRQENPDLVEGPEEWSLLAIMASVRF